MSYVVYFLIALADDEMSYVEENKETVNKFHLCAKTPTELICCYLLSRGSE